MAKTRLSGTDWRQWRRLRAWDLAQSGWGVRRIAQALAASPTAVSHWLALARCDGPEALFAHPHPGAPPKLGAGQKRLIADFLWHGPEAYGFRGDVWTAKRVAEVIDRTFGVRYHRDHVGRLLREAGWSRQQPIERATQRNEEAVKEWSEQRWPTIKKTVRAKAPTEQG